MLTGGHSHGISTKINYSIIIGNKSTLLFSIDTTTSVDWTKTKMSSVLLQVYLDLLPDQINMAVLFWYLVKSDASVRYWRV